MKTLFFLSVLFVLSSYVGAAQPIFTFDNNTHQQHIVLDTLHQNNSWQIGRPQKAVFDTFHCKSAAIATDTAFSLGPNDTSVFYINLPLAAPTFGDQFVGLAFNYSLDKDSASIAKLEVMVKGDWVNLTDTPFKHDQYRSFSDMRYPLIDTPQFYSSSEGWKKFAINLGNSMLKITTPSFRISFITSDTTQSVDGFMIDSIQTLYWHGDRVISIAEHSLSCFPNPAKGEFTIRGKSETNMQMLLVDVLGRQLLRRELVPENDFINATFAPGLPAGLYHITLTGDMRKQTIKLIIQ